MNDLTPIELSVAVPCCNESAVLPEFYRRVTAACAGVTRQYEIVFVDDGSSDGTWPVIRSLAENDSRVVGLSLSRNHGHQLALTAALSYCRGSRILILDADLQDPPELLPKMMSILDGGADVVYGKRNSRAGESLFKRFTAFLFYRLLNLFADQSIPEDTGDFRLITRRVLDVFNSMPENHRFIRGMISWVGFRQVALPYDRQPRLHGDTKYTLTAMFRFALDAITSFSVKPLRLGFYAAFALCGLSILLLGYSIYGYFFVRGVVPGWTSIMAVILFFLAAQFLLLGVIGEYVGRLYLEVKHRPLFMIQDAANVGVRKPIDQARFSYPYER